MTPMKINSASSAAWNGASEDRSDAGSRMFTDSGPRAVTSHSLTLRTPLFSVGFSWQKVEMEPTAATGGDAVPPSEKAATGKPQRQRQRQLPATPEEAKRRSQLANLLARADVPADEFPVISSPEPQPRPNARVVCRLYSQHAGPAAGDDNDPLPSC